MQYYRKENLMKINKNILIREINASYETEIYYYYLFFKYHNFNNLYKKYNFHTSKFTKHKYIQKKNQKQSPNRYIKKIQTDRIKTLIKR